MRPALATILASLVLVRSASAQPAAAPLTEPAQASSQVDTTSYRGYTLAADGLSIAVLFAAYASTRSDGSDSQATVPLLLLGIEGGFWLTPGIHSLRGHKWRAVGSSILRQVTMTAGAIIAIETKTCDTATLVCGGDRFGLGVAGGVAVASLIDAVFMTDETNPRATTWTPMLAPRQGGGTVGLAVSF